MRVFLDNELCGKAATGYDTPKGIEPVGEEPAVATINLVCEECKHSFTVLTPGAIKERQKRCLECGSTTVRQTLGSFLRNEALSSPTCGVVPTGG